MTSLLERAVLNNKSLHIKNFIEKNAVEVEDLFNININLHKHASLVKSPVISYLFKPNLGLKSAFRTNSLKFTLRNVLGGKLGALQVWKFFPSTEKFKSMCSRWLNLISH